MTKIRITTRNNSDARKFEVLADLEGVKTRHNGGKLVIAEVHESALATVRERLEQANEVKTYVVE
jgi:hypothetical protein